VDVLTGRVSLNIKICALGVAYTMGIFLYWICVWYHAQLLTGLFFNWNWLQIYPCLKRKNSFLWMEIFVCPLVEILGMLVLSPYPSSLADLQSEYCRTCFPHLHPNFTLGHTPLLEIVHSLAHFRLTAFR